MAPGLLALPASQWHCMSLHVIAQSGPSGAEVLQLCGEGSPRTLPARGRRRCGMALMAQLIARAMYSNPPMMGAHLVSNILGDPQMKQRWFVEVAPRPAHSRPPLLVRLMAAGPG